jgi:beta-glucosidase
MAGMLPGVNLHRSAYTARNYEYYSEDGVLSGKLAAKVISGAKANGLHCYLKHLVVSEEGPNPGGVNTWLTEQNLRENYLKPFEIAVKEGGANAMMSAFNRLGASWCGADYGLLDRNRPERMGLQRLDRHRLEPRRRTGWDEPSPRGAGWQRYLAQSE